MAPKFKPGTSFSTRRVANDSTGNPVDDIQTAAIMGLPPLDKQ